MATITILMTDEEVRVLESDLIDIEAWIDNVWRNKLRLVEHSIIKEYTDYRPGRLSPNRQKALIADIVLKTAREKEIKQQQGLPVSV